MAQDDRRVQGIAQMKNVYGWDIEEVHGSFVEQTVDHLFGEVWTREGMTQRERRLLLLGMLAADGLIDVLELQVDAALRLGELDARDLEDIVLFVAHYRGWPMGAKVNQVVTDLLARHTKTQAQAQAQAQTQAQTPPPSP